MEEMLRKRWKNDRRTGATLVLIALMLPVLLMLASFAINIAYIESINTEVQIVTDAAAKSAGKSYVVTGDKAAALAIANEVAQANLVASNFTIQFLPQDLEVGISTRASESAVYQFSAGANGNAIRLSTNSLCNGVGSAPQPLFPMLSDSQIRPLRTAVSTQGALDIALVVDASGSMAYRSDELAAYPPNPTDAPLGWDFGQPVPPNARWLSLVDAVAIFNQEIENTAQTELLALCVYNHSAWTPQPLTGDYSLINLRLNDISQAFEGGGTHIAAGIYEAMYAVRDPAYTRPYAAKVIVLMTDGVNNFFDDPIWASREAAEQGISIFTVSFSDEADQTVMTAIAQNAGGQHFHAINAQQLVNAFQQIAKRLPSILTE